MSIRSDRIKALIEQSNHSYQELEKITGIKKSSLQRYASGVTTKIPLDVIEKLSKAFNVSKTYLMGWEEIEKKNDQIVDLVTRLRKDADFKNSVEMLASLKPEQYESVKQILTAFTQQ